MTPNRCCSESQQHCTAVGTQCVTWSCVVLVVLWYRSLKDVVSMGLLSADRFFCTRCSLFFLKRKTFGLFRNYIYCIQFFGITVGLPSGGFYEIYWLKIYIFKTAVASRGTSCYLRWCQCCVCLPPAVLSFPPAHSALCRTAATFHSDRHRQVMIRHAR